jgi:hypothetical protein
MAESPKTAAAAPYTPSGAAASERMLSSVLGRVVGPYGAPISRSLRFADRLVDSVVEGAGPAGGRGPGQRLFAQPVFSPPGTPTSGERPGVAEATAPAASTRRERLVPTQDLLTARPEPRRAADLKLPRSLRPTMALSSPERMFGSGSKDEGDSGAEARRGSEAGRLNQPVLGSGWEPPVAHAALELKTAATPSPLWGLLSRPTLEPLIAAVEADLGRPATPAPAHEERRDRLPLALVQSSRRGERPASSITEEQAHQAALAASRQLMEAVRAHATAHGGADDRISLGDMTLIAFADSNKQMAAASSYTSNAPEPRPVAKALGQQAHPKVKEDQKDLHNKLRAMAKLVVEDLNQVKKLSKERFGAHG